MANESERDDRTEDPTQRRLDQAIERGDVAKSQEINTFFVVMFALNVLIGIVTQPHVMGVCAAGRTELDGRVGFVLWLGPDNRPISVDVNNEPGVRPDPATSVASAP